MISNNMIAMCYNKGKQISLQGLELLAREGRRGLMLLFLFFENVGRA